MRGPERQAEDEMSRSIRMPARVWKALDVDADSCRRSATKQLEAILTVYYGLDDVELGDVVAAREVASPYAARPGTLAFDRKLKFLTGGQPDDEPKKSRKR